MSDRHTQQSTSTRGAEPQSTRHRSSRDTKRRHSSSKEEEKKRTRHSGSSSHERSRRHSSSSSKKSSSSSGSSKRSTSKASRSSRDSERRVSSSQKSAENRGATGVKALFSSVASDYDEVDSTYQTDDERRRIAAALRQGTSHERAANGQQNDAGADALNCYERAILKLVDLVRCTSPRSGAALKSQVNDELSKLKANVSLSQTMRSKEEVAGDSKSEELLQQQTAESSKAVATIDANSHATAVVCAEKSGKEETDSAKDDTDVEMTETQSIVQTDSDSQIAMKQESEIMSVLRYDAECKKLLLRLLSCDFLTEDESMTTLTAMDDDLETTTETAVGKPKKTESEIASDSDRSGELLAIDLERVKRDCLSLRKRGDLLKMREGELIIRLCESEKQIHRYEVHVAQLKQQLVTTRPMAGSLIDPLINANYERLTQTVSELKDKMRRMQEEMLVATGVMPPPSGGMPKAIGMQMPASSGAVAASGSGLMSGMPPTMGGAVPGSRPRIEMSVGRGGAIGSGTQLAAGFSLQSTAGRHLLAKCRSLLKENEMIGKELQVSTAKRHAEQCSLVSAQNLKLTEMLQKARGHIGFLYAQIRELSVKRMMDPSATVAMSDSSMGFGEEDLDEDMDADVDMDADGDVVLMDGLKAAVGDGSSVVLKTDSVEDVSEDVKDEGSVGGKQAAGVRKASGTPHEEEDGDELYDAGLVVADLVVSAEARQETEDTTVDTAISTAAAVDTVVVKAVTTETKESGSGQRERDEALEEGEIT